MDRVDYEIRMVEHIKRVCPNDLGGQMVLVAFAQDSVNREFGVAAKRTEKSGDTEYRHENFNRKDF